MLVILRENVENLGRVGDLVKVTNGYARNYLLPRNLVAIAGEGNVRAIEHQKKMLAKRRAAQVASAKEMAAKLEGTSCTIARKVGENDKLFGSVSAQDIQEALKGAGFTVERRSIHVLHPIRSLGVHPVEVKLETDVVATLKVWVVKEQ
jgi:large subunit ribosomal protein L9